MALTRRGFLQALARSVAAGVAAAKIPAAWLFPSTPTVGGTNHATFTFWRNQTADGHVSPPLDPAMMREIYNSCSAGGNLPEAIIVPESWLSDGRFEFPRDGSWPF